MNEELMFIAGEFLNSEKWLHAVNESYTAQQTAIAESYAEVLKIKRLREEVWEAERARMEAREGEKP